MVATWEVPGYESTLRCGRRVFAARATGRTRQASCRTHPVPPRKPKLATVFRLSGTVGVRSCFDRASRPASILSSPTRRPLVQPPDLRLVFHRQYRFTHLPSNTPSGTNAIATYDALRVRV